MRHVEKIAFALMAACGSASAATITVNVTGDPAGGGNCPTSCSLRQAIAFAINNDVVDFASGLASPINLTQGPLLVTKPLTIIGPGPDKLTISAQNNTAVLTIDSAVSVSKVTLADGSVTGATGSPGAPSSGGPGGPGGDVGGACLLVTAGSFALLYRVAIHHCVAHGGTGGAGGSGFNDVTFMFPGGPGGAGGAGGAAHGAAVFVYGTLNLFDSSVVDGSAHGGDGGSGGMGGFGTPFGVDGLGGLGGSAVGGAIYAAIGASLRIRNTTISSSSAAGGTGGTSPSIFFPLPGGGGGSAAGGLVGVDSSVTLADIEFATLVNGQVVAGPGGAGGTGGTTPGPNGTISANAVAAATTTNALSSVIVGVQASVSLCDAAVTAAGGTVNLSEDNSCTNFTLHDSFANVFTPLDINATPWPGYMPIYQSVVIDAASTCQDLLSQPVFADQHGTARPQGTKCDLGAIEADYVFVDGFE